MRLRRRSALALAGIAIGGTAAGGASVVASCAPASSGSEHRPTPALASSPAAGAAFEAIREAWRTPDKVNVATLRASIESFLARFPSDGLVPLARVYLALVALYFNDSATTEKQLT